jgi:hypothetical protein
MSAAPSGASGPSPWLPPQRPQPFSLQCFEQAPAGVTVQGQVARQGEQLMLHYRVQDPQGLLRLPPPPGPPRRTASAPQRRHQLWTRTCLELFLAEVGATPYWEVNLCPSGDWNLYRLSDYRQDLTPEPAVESLPFAVERQAEGLDLHLPLDLSRLLPPGRPLELGLCAVLQERSGAISYWALRHPGPEADFHRREGFGLRL